MYTVFQLRRKFLTSEDEHSRLRVLSGKHRPHLHEWPTRPSLLSTSTRMLARRSHPMLADIHAAGLLSLLHRTPMEFGAAKQGGKMINSRSHRVTPEWLRGPGFLHGHLVPRPWQSAHGAASRQGSSRALPTRTQLNDREARSLVTILRSL